MINIEVKKINFGSIAAEIIEDADRALEQSMEDLREKVISDEVIPYSDQEIEKDGSPHIHMQDTMDRVEHIGNHQYSIGVEKEYAARVYYGTDMNFSLAQNRHAKALWFDDYGPGGRREQELIDDFYKHLNE